ncbi:hypothetical protein ACLBXM_02630 [Xanthobacteraceae bacterium A53D]
MSFDIDSKDAAAKFVVEIIKSATELGGAEGDIHDMVEQILQALLLADERLFGTSREDSLTHLTRMAGNVAHRLTANGGGSGQP